MITVITPTYNRESELPALYSSLLKQTNKNFEWLVVDDGSKDNTQQLISNYQAENLINIRYIKKENGGKHTALNVAFSDKYTGDWLFVVDSDDYLSSDCIEVLENEVSMLPMNYHSIRMLRVDKNGTPYSDYFVEGLSNYLDLQNSGAKNDIADVFRKSALTGFKFPEFKGENFMAESPLYIWLGATGFTKFINFKGYISEYLEGGLTDNSVANRHRCFNSALYVYEHKYKCHELKFILRFKCALNWWRFRVFKGPLERDFTMPIYFLPLGLALYILDKFKARAK
jgi:glycosyltransferase involved in cell wall biosynthesis